MRILVNYVVDYIRRNIAMSLPTVKVSDKKVVPIRVEKDPRPIKGSDWFEKCFANIALIAQTKSGKTTVISNIMKHCGGSKTKYLIISSTLHSDVSWETILGRIPEDMQFSYDQLITDEGEDVIAEFLHENLKAKEEPRDEPMEVKQTPVMSNVRPSNSLFSSLVPAPTTINRVETQEVKLEQSSTQGKQPEESKPKKERKSKLLYPDWIVVLDDLGKSMHSNLALGQLLRTNRHLKAMVIMAGQTLNDLNPSQISQLDYTILFRNIPEKKLKEAYEKLSLYLPYEKFIQLYDDATSLKFGFLYITRDGEFRKSFTDKYLF